MKLAYEIRWTADGPWHDASTEKALSLLRRAYGLHIPVAIGKLRDGDVVSVGYGIALRAEEVP